MPSTLTLFMMTNGDVAAYTPFETYTTTGVAPVETTAATAA